MQENLEKKTFQCEQCQKIFLSNKNLKSHMRMHRTNEKLEQCSVCRKEYLTNNSLRKHMREHDVARHRCQYCEKIFPLKRYLKGHVIRSHREHQVFECGACPAQSWSRYGFKIHQQIHNNELTQNHVKCTMCWKSFFR